MSCRDLQMIRSGAQRRSDELQGIAAVPAFGGLSKRLARDIVLVGSTPLMNFTVSGQVIVTFARTIDSGTASR